MSDRELQFVVLFNALWYKEFPIAQDFLGLGSKAGWTLHIMSAVREAASLMGLFMTFETGGKTDGEIHSYDKDSPRKLKTWAKVESEHQYVTSNAINELTKLKNAVGAEKCQVAIFFGRFEKKKFNELLPTISDTWRQAKKPLLCFLLEVTGEARVPWIDRKHNVKTFGELSTYRCFPGQDGETIKLCYKQAAYPWEVEGTKWAASRLPTLPNSR